MKVIWIIITFNFRAIYAFYNIKTGGNMTGSNRLVLILLKKKKQKHPNNIILLLYYSQNESVEFDRHLIFTTIVT